MRKTAAGAEQLLRVRVSGRKRNCQRTDRNSQPYNRRTLLMTVCSDSMCEVICLMYYNS